MKAIRYYAIFIILYSVLTTTTSIFLLSWGSKPTVWEQIYVFFIGKPFDWTVSLWYVPINGFFWAAIFNFLYWVVRRLRQI